MSRRKTVTGRMSAFKPRLQNIPVRSAGEPARLSDEVKVSIRAAAHGDKVSIRSAVHGDYAALEARILAAALTPLRPGGTE